MTDTMPAARLNLSTFEFAVEEVPIPAPGPGEVLVGLVGGPLRLVLVP